MFETLGSYFPFLVLLVFLKLTGFSFVALVPSSCNIMQKISDRVMSYRLAEFCLGTRSGLSVSRRMALT